MFYGHAPHTPSDLDLTLLRCRKCDWLSPELTRDQMRARGVPWYCDACGERVTSWVTFHPSERAAAYEAI